MAVAERGVVADSGQKLPMSGVGRVPAGRGAWVGPLFIVGMPRSGTKLLRGLLNQHPRICVPDIETDFFPFLVRWVRENGRPQSEAEFSRLFATLKGATYFASRQPDRETFSWRAWRAHCKPGYDAASLFEGFIRYEIGSLPDDPSVIWGDKSPAYIRRIDLLLEHFPDARVIHIIRDVRDYCVSMRKAWNKDVRRAAFQWGKDVSAAHRICQDNPQRCVETRYEDLLRSPEQEMQRLCRFLQIAFTDAMLKLGRPAENHGDAVGRVEIVRDNVSKFAVRLTRAEICGVEALAWDAMNLLGYEPLCADGPRRLSAFELTLRRMKDGVHLVLSSGRGLGVARALRFHLNHFRLSS